VAAGSRNRRAGELLGLGVPTQEIAPRLGQTAEALDALPLLARALREDGLAAPTVEGLAAVVEGRDDAASWAQAVTTPRPRAKPRRAA
jgi:glycerol-3-phosphate dehydrogenase (NAD(P)+)